ncbi:MAG: DUF308 domain-containing protein [Lachnospiraceae bacterium]|nr:DUF308 domain-containing protein [Lachnospiraceae bacterium]
MEEEKKKGIPAPMMTSIALILCGLILVIWPRKVQEFIMTVVAAAIMMIGIFYIIQYLRKDVRKDFYRKDLTTGIFAIILGVLAFIRGDMIAAVVPTVLGIVVLYSGVAKLQNAFDLLRMNANTWIPVMVSAGINIVFAVLMIIKPEMFNDMLFMFLGIGLLFGGITDLLSMLFFNKQTKDLVKADQSKEV